MNIADMRRCISPTREGCLDHIQRGPRRTTEPSLTVGLLPRTTAPHDPETDMSDQSTQTGAVARPSGRAPVTSQPLYWKYRVISEPIHFPTGTETPFPIIR